MYKDTVTLWHFAGEDERRATWRRHVFAGVQADETSGAVASLQGRQSTSGLAVYIPGVVAAGYGETWEIADGDAIVVGLVESDQPPKDAYRVTGHEPHRSRHRLHHLEVAAS